MTEDSYQPEGYIISTDPDRLQIGVIYDYLSKASYWAQGRPMEIVEKSINHSLCFGIYHGGEQVGFARVVTDRATFAWLCDVFVLESHRSKGLGKWLVQTVVAHPDLQTVNRICLATRDAHELYRQYGGFQSIPNPDYYMIRPKSNR